MFIDHYFHKTVWTGEKHRPLSLLHCNNLKGRKFLKPHKTKSKIERIRLYSKFWTIREWNLVKNCQTCDEREKIWNKHQNFWLASHVWPFLTKCYLMLNYSSLHRVSKVFEVYKSIQFNFYFTDFSKLSLLPFGLLDHLMGF